MFLTSGKLACATCIRIVSMMVLHKGSLHVATANRALSVDDIVRAARLSFISSASVAKSFNTKFLVDALAMFAAVTTAEGTTYA